MPRDFALRQHARTRLVLLVAFSIGPASVAAAQSAPEHRPAHAVEVVAQAAYVVVDFGLADATRSAEGAAVALRLAYRPATWRARLSFEASFVASPRSDADRRPGVTLVGATSSWASAPQDGPAPRAALFAALGVGALWLEAPRTPSACGSTPPCFDEYHDYVAERRLTVSGGVGAIVPLGRGIAARADLRAHRAMGEAVRNRFAMRTKPELAAGLSYRF